MKYDRKEIFELAKAVVVEHNLYFVDDVIAYLPCSKSTFYDSFPDGSEELDDIKRLLNINRVKIKVDLRKKWNESDNATLQMGLYKLIATDDERKKLSMTHNQADVSDQNITITINFDE